MFYTNLKYIFTPKNANLLFAQLFVYIVYSSACIHIQTQIF